METTQLNLLSVNDPSLGRNLLGLPIDCLHRFLSHVYVDSSTGCWLWTASTDEHGYGLVYFQRKRDGLKASYKTHRLAYELAVGVIAPGNHIHHKCGAKRCCNPEHLESVTPVEHATKDHSAPYKQKRQTHCHNGHPLEGNNLVAYYGKRQCRICANINRRARYQAWRAANPLEDRTHCVNGHELVEDNVFFYKASNGNLARGCRACSRERAAEGRERRRQQADADPTLRRRIAPNKTRCVHGHCYTETGFYVKRTGEVVCAQCARDYINTKNAEKREEVLAAGGSPNSNHPVRTKCASGHDLTNPDNVMKNTKNPKHLRCRICAREWDRRKYWATKLGRPVTVEELRQMEQGVDSPAPPPSY